MTWEKGLESWWRDGHIHQAKSVPLRIECERVESQVLVTGFIGRLN